MKIFFDTLGCPKNISDSEFAMALLEKRGFSMVESPDEADVIVVFMRDFHDGGVVQQRGHIRFDAPIDRGREQQRLARRGRGRHNLLHRGQKSHVEHAVGFVEHQCLYLAKIQAFLLDQIEQAARGGDKHFDPAADFFDLRLDVDTAKSAQTADRQISGVSYDRLVDLNGQLTRRRKNKDAYGMACG